MPIFSRLARTDSSTGPSCCALCVPTLQRLHLCGSLGHESFVSRTLPLSASSQCLGARQHHQRSALQPHRHRILTLLKRGTYAPGLPGAHSIPSREMSLPAFHKIADRTIEEYQVRKVNCVGGLSEMR